MQILKGNSSVEMDICRGIDIICPYEVLAKQCIMHQIAETVMLLLSPALLSAEDNIEDGHVSNVIPGEPIS